MNNLLMFQMSSTVCSTKSLNRHSAPFYVFWPLQRNNKDLKIRTDFLLLAEASNLFGLGVNPSLVFHYQRAGENTSSLSTHPSRGENELQSWINSLKLRAYTFPLNISMRLYAKPSRYLVLPSLSFRYLFLLAYLFGVLSAHSRRSCDCLRAHSAPRVQNSGKLRVKRRNLEIQHWPSTA